MRTHPREVHTAARGRLQSCRVCGISFHESAVELRERVAVPSELLTQAYSFWLSRPGIRECMVLSTCNRTEVYLSAEEWVDAREMFLGFARSVRGWDLEPAAGQVYDLRGVEAVGHSFRVASSMDSLVMGESQIFGQFKSAFRTAENHEAVGKDLHRWISRAFMAAKSVRAQTGIGEATVNVSYAAVQLARKVFESLSGKLVVLLGAGKMSELAAVHLKEAGASAIVVANRTWSKAWDLTRRFGGVSVEFSKRLDAMSESDLVICSTEARDFILDLDDVRRVMAARRHRPLLILDISVPRNVDPRVAELECVYLFDIDDLKQVVEANRAERRAEAGRAESILQRQIEDYVREESHADLAPTIAALRNQVHNICRVELDRFRRKKPDLTPQEIEQLELMLHRLAQKILHPVIAELKTAESRNSLRSVQLMLQRVIGYPRDPAP